MEAWLTDHYAQLWYFGYAGSLFFFMLAENLFCFRSYDCPVTNRIATNISLLVINSSAQRLLLPIVPITLALYYQDNSGAILNYLGVPFSFKMVLSILVVDFSGYFFHFILHRYPWLWRIHYPHHTDIDFDATTGLRFHPFEAVLTTCFSMIVIIVFGIPAVIIMLMDILHIVTGFFTHWNILIPDKLDNMLRKVIVTPNMHRIHHSAKTEESMTNYGIVFSFWDRLFNTYLKMPSGRHRYMALGTPSLRNPNSNRVVSFLCLPFRKPQKNIF